MAVDIARAHRERTLARMRAAVADAKSVLCTALDQLLIVTEEALSFVASESPASTNDDVLTLEQAAEVLTVSVDTLRRLTERGDVAYVEVPSPSGDRPMRRYLRSDLNTNLRRWRQEAAS